MALFKQSHRRGLICLLLLIGWMPLTGMAETGLFESPELIERVIWHKTPIAVVLKVGEERLIHFPDSVSAGVPKGLTPYLRSQSINGTLYLTAHQPFAATRVMVRSQNEGPIYVLDIFAQASEPQSLPLPALQIRLSNMPDDLTETDKSVFNEQGYVALTRFVAQQLYAPSRLLRNTPGIVRVPVSMEPVDLVRGGQVAAFPIASWRAGFRTVTAVKLVNTTQAPVILDPRHLRGTWFTATFQHNRLLGAGSDADSTAVYLISARPFALSL